MADEARQAKAEAKAAKAKAKSLRPFYKKKRWWLVAVIAIAVIAAIAGSSGGSSSEVSTGNTDSESPTETIGKGIGSSDASADIVNLDCGSPDAIGVTYPAVTVKNNSSKPSNYFITIVAESPDGGTRYDDTTVYVSALNPDQSMTEKGMFTNELPQSAVCKVTEVQRTAA